MKKALVKFIESKYTLILLCVLFAVVIFYVLTSSLKIEDSLNDQQKSLEELTSNTLEHNFEQMQKLTQIISYDRDISTFIEKDEIVGGTKDIQVVINAEDKINSLRNIDPLIKNIYVYSKINGLLLSFNNAYFNLDSMYESLLKYEDYNYLQWKQKYLLSKESNKFHKSILAKIDGKKSNVITYSTNIVKKRTNTNNGKLIILLDTDYLNKILESSVKDLNGFALIVNKDNKILTSYNYPLKDFKLNEEKKITIDNTSYNIHLVNSSKTQLKYIYAIPMFNSTMVVTYVSLIVIIFVIIVILLITIIYFGILNDREKKWRELSKLTGSNKVNYEDLVFHIKAILDDEDDETKTFFTLETLFRRLIHGEQTPTEVLAKAINIEANSRITMVKIVLNDIEPDRFTNESLDDINFTRAVSERTANKMFKNGFYIYMDYSFSIWILLSETDQKLIDSYYKTFTSLIPGTASMLVSNEKNNVKLLSETRIECNSIEKLVVNEGSNNKLVYYSDIKSRVDKYNLSEKLEDSIIKSIREKDLKTLDENLNTLYKENYENRKLSINSNNEFLEQLTRICKICACVNDLTCFNTFKNASNYLRLLISSDNFDKEKELISLIDSEIEKNCGDYNFNLAELASILNVRENYLYHFISTRFNVSFSKYLETIRLEKASKMLETTGGKDVAKIAKKCGYINAQTFRRAFYKHYKILPSHYNR